MGRVVIGELSIGYADLTAPLHQYEPKVTLPVVSLQ